MQPDASATFLPHARVVGEKSWLAYAGVLLLAAALIAAFAALRRFEAVDDIVAGAFLAVSALVVAYRFLLVRSVQLYYDDVGVWAFSGVLPWKKGVVGVKWRDMDEAAYERGFWSWVTRSYTVHITNRYTKESEIVLTHVGNGKHSVGVLVTRHQELIRAGIID